MPYSKTVEAEPTSRFNRIFCWRTLWQGLVGIVVLSLFVMLFYAEEDWRGKRAWANYQRVLKTKGVDFNWRSLAPVPVADGDNFAATPFFAALFDFAPGTHTPRNMAAYNRTAGFAQTGALYEEQRSADPVPEMLERRRANLAAGLERFRKTKGPAQKAEEPKTKESSSDRTVVATAVLETLQPFNPVLEELRVASHRPLARYNISYDSDTTWKSPQPHLPVLKRVSRVLTLRASAALALHNAPAAADDVELILKLANSIREEPFPSSHWARYAMLANARQIIWEGLADHRWSDGQLAKFELLLAEHRLLENLQKPLRLEQASQNEFFGELHRDPSIPKRWRFGPGIGNWILPCFLWLMPTGWMYQEQVAYHSAFEGQLLPALDPEGSKMQSVRIHQIGRGGAPLWNHCFISNLLLQSIGRLLTETALAQTRNDEALLACSLERYRLANGQFPGTLDALSPRYLAAIPADVITGQSLKYRRTEDGQFQLYSVGWNGKDDGGEIGMNKEGNAPDDTQGDWVWPPYPDQL